MNLTPLFFPAQDAPVVMARVQQRQKTRDLTPLMDPDVVWQDPARLRYCYSVSLKRTWNLMS